MPFPRICCARSARSFWPTRSRFRTRSFRSCRIGSLKADACSLPPTRPRMTHFEGAGPRHGILHWNLDSDEIREEAKSWYVWSEQDFTEFRVSDEAGNTDGGLESTPDIRPHGKGLLGYWPHINVPGKRCLANSFMQPEELLPPENAKEIRDFLNRLHGPFEVEIQAPPSLLVESAWRPETGETLLHLVHTDASAGPIDVTLNHRNAWNNLEVLSPDPLPPRVEESASILRLSSLSRYAVLKFGKETSL